MMHSYQLSLIYTFYGLWQINFIIHYKPYQFFCSGRFPLTKQVCLYYPHPLRAGDKPYKAK